MRTVLLIIAILLLLAGFVWTGQGLGYIKGSFMTGSPFWAVVGIVCLLVGAGLVYWRFARMGRPV